MPDPTDPGAAIAPPPDVGGAVPSGGAGPPPGGPDQIAAGQAPGVLPPTTAPQAQNVPPAGLDALGMDFARKAMAMLHLARMALNPYGEPGKAVDKMWHAGIKHFSPDSEAMKSGGMAKPGQPQRGAGTAPPGAPMGPGAMPPPAPPQGPIPMKAGMPA